MADLLEVMRGRGLAALAHAVEDAGLGPALRHGGPFTVFAPDDEAFARLEDGAPGRLARADELVALLGLHIVPGRLDAAALGETAELLTLLGETVAVTRAGGVLTVGGVPVVRADAGAANGVLHETAGFLAPAGAPARA